MVEGSLTKSDYRAFLDKAISYDLYLEGFKHAQAKHKAGEGSDNPQLAFLDINLQRSLRIAKTFTLWAPLKQALDELPHEVHWLILTEYWCGDSAQCLPALQQVALASNGKISLSLLFRDEQPELMQHFLSSGSKSIPKLIQVDKHMNLSGIWGPRPAEAQQLVKRLKADPSTAGKYQEALHSWYAADKCFSIQKEILQLIKRASGFCPDCLG